MLNMPELNKLNIIQAHQGLISKQFSSTELTKSCLDEINKSDKNINAFITVTLEQALEKAKKVDEKLREQLSGGQDLIPPGEGDIEYAVEDVTESTKSALIRVTAKAGKMLGEDTATFSKKNLVGLNKEQIGSYFMSYPDIIDVQVHFYPAWVTRAPFLTDHINVMLKKWRCNRYHSNPQSSWDQALIGDPYDLKREKFYGISLLLFMVEPTILEVLYL